MADLCQCEVLLYTSHYQPDTLDDFVLLLETNKFLLWYVFKHLFIGSNAMIRREAPSVIIYFKWNRSVAIEIKYYGNYNDTQYELERIFTRLVHRNHKQRAFSQNYCKKSRKLQRSSFLRYLLLTEIGNPNGDPCLWASSPGPSACKWLGSNYGEQTKN